MITTIVLANISITSYNYHFFFVVRIFEVYSQTLSILHITISYSFPVRFQGKPFNIMVIQVYAPTSNAEEAEVEQIYEDLQDLIQLTPKKKISFSS